jgi:ABC-type sugar transport system permease subunit
MIAPAVVLVSLFIVIPVGIAVFLSLTDWNGFADPNWVGLANYAKMGRDQALLRAAAFTGAVAVFGTLGINVLGLGTALLLNRNTRVNRVMRFLAFSPFVLGPVVLGFLWGAILGGRGAVNALLKSAGLATVPFLAQPAWARFSVIFVVVWASSGFHLVLYLAGLQSIDQSLIEAAVVDGASPWKVFWRVKLPVLAPTVTLNLVLAMIGMVKVYEWVLTLTAGGPAGRTATVAYQILTVSLEKSQLGYGAAQSVVLMLVLIILTLAVTQARRRSEQDVAA